MVNYAYTALIIYLLAPLFATAQNDSDERTAITGKALARAVRMYDEVLGNNASIFTGAEYAFNYGTVRGHQFFFDDYWELGQIWYNGSLYDSIYLKYDILNDLILVEHFSSNGAVYPIRLYTPKIKGFTVFGHRFIWHEQDTLSALTSGFYDQLYVGDDVALIAKRKKEIVRTNLANTLQDDFVEKNRYYLRNDGNWFQVKKGKSVIKILDRHKREMRSFIRSNELSFNDTRERDLTLLLKYYNSLQY